MTRWIAPLRGSSCLKAEEFCLRSHLGNQCLRICVRIYPSVAVTLFLFFRSPRMDFLVLFLLYLALVLLGFVMICIGSKTHYLQGLISRGAQVTVMLGDHLNTTSLKGLTSQGALVVKNLPASAGDKRDAGSTPGSGSSLGGGHGNPLQRSCLGNPMDRGAWWATVHVVTKSWRRPSTHTHTHTRKACQFSIRTKRWCHFYLFVHLFFYLRQLWYIPKLSFSRLAVSLDLMPIIGHGCEKCMPGGPWWVKLGLVWTESWTSGYPHSRDQSEQNWGEVPWEGVGWEGPGLMPSGLWDFGLNAGQGKVLLAVHISITWSSPSAHLPLPEDLQLVPCVTLG